MQTMQSNRWRDYDAVDKLVIAFSVWALLLMVGGSFALVSKDYDAWHRGSDDCYIHTHVYKHPFASDKTTNTTYCKE